MSGRAVRVPAEPQVRSRVRVGDVLQPASDSPFGPLVEWLRSGRRDWQGTPTPPVRSAGPARLRTVDPDPSRAEPGWLAEHLAALGFAAQHPEVGTVGWLDHRMRH